MANTSEQKIKGDEPVGPVAPNNEKAVLVESIPTTEDTLGIGDETQEEWFKETSGTVETELEEWA